MENSKQISTPINGRQLVIPDIHGCLDTLVALYEKLNPTKADQILFLGDYINRGPKSAGVIDFILDLIEQGFEVYPLRGNHEQMAIDSHSNILANPNLKRVPSLQKRRGLVDSRGLLLEKYQDFFFNLPYYYELENHYLVHAGFDFKSPNPFENYEQMMWLRESENDEAFTKGKQIIHGHQSEFLHFIQQDMANKAKIIGLDNGVYKVSYEGKGNLCCLDLTNNQLFVQPTIDEMKSSR
ncbi:MAG: serine/threonine protein phosphatase 1 [Flammeovirgaceae bacterium]|jgi:serine/threonine protein phosphatase 1